MQRRIFVLTGLLLLAGCASDKSFVPSGVSLTNTAHVTTDSESYSANNGARVIYITEVDGKETTNAITPIPPIDIYLTPGDHTIMVVYLHGGLAAKRIISLTVKGGTEYRVHEQTLGYNVHFWVTEGKNGGIVAGSKN